MYPTWGTHAGTIGNHGPLAEIRPGGYTPLPASVSPDARAPPPPPPPPGTPYPASPFAAPAREWTPRPSQDERLITSYINNCLCTERQVRLTFVVVLLLGGIVVLALVLFVRSIDSVRDWVRQKQDLKAGVRSIARRTAAMLEARSRTDPPPPPLHEDPAVLGWMDRIEAVRLGDDGRGFAFALDGGGGVWAHGRATHLARGQVGRVPGFHNASDLDEPGSPSRAGPTTVRDLVRIAKRGGGFVHFRWKRGVLMVAYVCPVPASDLIIAGAIEIPRSQRAWEEKNWVRNVHQPGVRDFTH